MFRKVSVLTLAAAVAIVAAAPPATAVGEASGFVSRINSARAGAGLDALEVYWDLTDDARRHTAEMVEAGEIFHSANLGGVTSGWWALGENVGVGGDVAGLHEAFMASPPHRQNILGDFNYVGVGTAYSEDGYLYVTVIFMKGPEGLVSPPAEEDPPVEDDEPPPPEAPSDEQPAETPPPEDSPPSDPAPESSSSPQPVKTRSAHAPQTEPTLPQEGWLTALILNMVAAGLYPCLLPGGLTLF